MDNLKYFDKEENDSGISYRFKPEYTKGNAPDLEKVEISEMLKELLGIGGEVNISLLALMMINMSERMNAMQQMVNDIGVVVVSGKNESNIILPNG